jgi:hypothetical protein
MRIEKKELYPARQVPAFLAAAWAGHTSKRKPEAVGADDFPVFADDPLREWHLIINRFLEETGEEHGWMVAPSEQPSGKKLLAGDARWRGRAILAAASRVVWAWKAPRWNKEWKSWVYGEQLLNSFRPLLSALFQTEFEITEPETIELARMAGGPCANVIGQYLPALGAVMAVEKAFKGKTLSAQVRKDLMRLLRQLISHAVPKAQATESSRIWRKLGADEAIVKLEDPNAAFRRLADLMLDEAALVELVEEVQKPHEEFHGFVTQVGAVSALLDLLEPFLANHAMPASVRTGLAAIQTAMEHGRVHKAEQKELGRIRSLLGGPSTVEIEPGEAWSERARADLQSFGPKQAPAWSALLAHCTTAESSKPAKKWLTAAAELVNIIGRDEFKTTVLQWFSLVALPRPVHREPAHPQWEADPDQLITDRNATILKGLAWSCAGFKDAELSRALSELAEVCFKKVRWLGPRCPRVGNACLYSLSSTATEDAAAQLSKLDQVVKQPTAKKRIGKSLDKAAETTGQTRADLEEKSVPTFGLGLDGKLTRQLGEYKAELRVEDARNVEIQWFGADAKPQKSVPAKVKREHGADLKQLQKLAKDIEKMLAAQRIRLERLLMTGREWDMETWRQRYLDQPLLAPIARRLIWHFKRGEQTALGIWFGGKLVDVNSRPLDWLARETRVRLWHPIGFPVETVAAWRRWLETNQVCQPCKQAHREIYVLTDAELTTETYSNRFAAHIIGQHQFAALATQRGWKYSFMGGFDSQSTPTLELPAWSLVTEFWVNPTAELAETGVSRYLATDQVRFLRDAQPIALSDVPAPVFTEVMRDVDLFVGVCSIGNDPAWQDRGEIAGGGTYWQSYSFGDLSASAKTRRDVLERLLPKLKIGKQCELRDKFLVVTGTLRTYKIHLGSGNILMEPNDQYLCIVPERGQAASGKEDVFLPFEGDHTLSVILSKAFFLAADGKIKDPTIIGQIKGAKA